MRGFLSVVETAELLNIFLIILMVLFLNAQSRAEFPVQILCLLMNRDGLGVKAWNKGKFKL